ncbi:MAG: putative CtpA-like serine protease [Pelotomaculum sp. PtaU1.Bin035]|nr:MAG: putative CtpA-like serine protease [Pelotomaculum sp. PtaU1.Bin035]
MRKLFMTLALMFVLLLCFTGPSYADDNPVADNPVIDRGTFEEIFDYVQRFHISKPASDIMIRGAIEGLIGSLNDPYTVYMPPEQLKDFNDSLDGGFVGVGIHLRPGERYPVVVDTIENTPAEKAGIKPNDQVIKVDGEDVANEPLGKVVQKIRGPEGTKVLLNIRREGADDFELELARSSINVPTVNWKVLDDGSGYIRINTFGVYTSEEFTKALTDLNQQGVADLVLDLRDNPGGILSAAVRIASSFVEPGQVVVSTVDRNGKREEHRTEGRAIGKGMQVAVLVDHDSASAAEILAGALQDYQAATIIGGRTYGKGTVQVVVPLDAGGALKLTVAEYHTPKDSVINGIGLSPDIQVITPGLQMFTAQHLFKPSEKNTVDLELEKPEAIVNGMTVQLKYPAVRFPDATYLPLRFALEALGYRVDWQPADSSVRVTGHGSDMILYTEDGRAISGGQVIPVAAPLLIDEGVTYIPLSDLNIFDISSKIDGSKISIEK